MLGSAGRWLRTVSEGCLSLAQGSGTGRRWGNVTELEARMDPITIKVVTLPFVQALGGFDQAPLEALARQAEILETAPAFFEYGGTPYWSLAVTCRLRPAPGDPEYRSGKRSEGRPAPSPPAGRGDVADSDIGLFQALRSWRAETADQRGVPAYMILTNRQLADIARLKPPSLASLGTVPGIGPGRLQKHGKAILEIVGRGAAEPLPSGEKQAPGETVSEADQSEVGVDQPESSGSVAASTEVSYAND